MAKGLKQVADEHEDAVRTISQLLLQTSFNERQMTSVLHASQKRVNGEMSERREKEVEENIIRLYASHRLAHMHRAFGYTDEKDFEERELVFVKVREFFKEPEHNIGNGEIRFTIVPPSIPTRALLAMLTKSVGAVAHEQVIHDVSEPSGSCCPRAIITPEYLAYESKMKSLVLRPKGWYAPYGVNGSKRTEQYTFDQSLTHFRKNRRIALGIREAIALYIDHPKFLIERSLGIVCLGEWCYETPDTSVRTYPLLRYLPTEDKVLITTIRNSVSGEGFGKPSAVGFLSS